MYKLTVTKTGTEYTIPKENLGLLAYTKAMDTGYGAINFKDTKLAIDFLTSQGILVEDYDD